MIEMSIVLITDKINMSFPPNIKSYDQPSIEWPAKIIISMITKITFSVLATNYPTRLKSTTKKLIRYGMIRCN